MPDRQTRAQAPELTIAQLSAETGTSVRTIRSYRSRRLLPAPVVRAGIGYYNQEHVARIRRIVYLQAQGFKLGAIERLLPGRGPSFEQLAGLVSAITAPLQAEHPELLSGAELAGRLGEVDNSQTAKAQKLGLIVSVGDGVYEAPNPVLLGAVEEVVKRGVPLATALSVIEQVKRHCEATSNTFVQLFLDHVWKPFDEAGQPSERWLDVTEAIERLRPLASEVVLASFNETMEAAMDQAFGAIVEQQAARGRRL